MPKYNVQVFAVRDQTAMYVDAVQVSATSAQAVGLTDFDHCFSSKLYQDGWVPAVVIQQIKEE